MATVFSVYDATGGQTINNSSPIVLNLDTTTVDEPSASSPFSLASDVLTITDSGEFLFLIRVTATYDSGSTAAGYFASFLESDTGSGWFEISGSKCFVSTEDGTLLGSKGYSASSESVVSVTSGDKFRVGVSSSSDSTVWATTPDASALIAYKLAPDVSSYAALTAVDAAADYVLVWDTSASLHKKVLISDLTRSYSPSTDKSEFLAQLAGALAAGGTRIRSVSDLLATAAAVAEATLTGDPAGDALSFLRNSTIRRADAPGVAKAIRGLIDAGATDSGAFGGVS